MMMTDAGTPHSLPTGHDKRRFAARHQAARNAAEPGKLAGPAAGLEQAHPLLSDRGVLQPTAAGVGSRSPSMRMRS